jgi:hypothetical protein
MVKNGKAHTRWAQGMGTSSIRLNQRNPLALTRGLWEERAGSRSIPFAWIFASRRRSKMSSNPSTRGPVGAGRRINRSHSRWEPSRLDQMARFKTR